MKLNWVTSSLTSTLHAAEAICRDRPFADEKLREEIAAPSKELDREISVAGLPSEAMWRQLLQFSHRPASSEQLAQLALRKGVGLQATRESLVVRLAGRIADTQAAFLRAVPNWESELALRSRPLKEQWEARGPGLLRQVALLTDERLLAEQADVVLLYPALGGGGTAHLLTNSVRIEAVLTNVLPDLPEVLRLGWMLGQLQHELPIFSERVAPPNLQRLARLGMLPPTLSAGAIVELSSLDQEILAQALQAWCVEDTSHEDTARVLLDWWDTYVESKPNWEVAVAALDHMLSANDC